MRPHRPIALPSSWISITLTAVLLAAGFLLLSGVYESCFPAVVRRLNIWFGADVPRYLRWMRNDEIRSILHPISFLVYRGYGQALTAVGLTPVGAPLAAIALPAVLVSSFGISLAAGLFLAPADRSLLRVAGVAAVLLLVGPALLFGPIPESHMPGGAALLVEAALLYDGIRLRTSGGARRSALIRVALAALFGVIAAGFSLSNAVPAALFLLSLLSCFGLRLSKLGTVAAAAVLAAAGLAALILLSTSQSTRNLARYESRFMQVPTFQSVAISLEAATAKQFGVPEVGVRRSDDPFLRTLVLAPRGWFAPVPALGFLLWMAAIVLWNRRNHTCRCIRRFVWASLAAFLSMVFFYASYGTNEAYLFSPHSWPFLVAPGLAVIADALRRPRRAESIALAGALSLSVLQTAIGMASLFGTAGAPWHPP